MKLAVIQLSDIHVTGSGDVAHRYVPQIATVFNELSFPSIDGVVVLLCGDVAYSGKDAQYVAFAPTLQELSAELARTTGCKPEVIVIPGNHDCDMALDDAVRQLLIQSIPNGQTNLSDKSVVEQCLKVQAPFWRFAQDPTIRVPEKNADNLYLEHLLQLGSRKLRFRCYNTPWVSQNPEQPGRMAFPRRYYEGHDAEPRLDLTIAVLHHPTHWFTPTRKRQFDAVIDHAADLVLFGHEHLPEEYTKSDFSGNRVGYIFGGVFQENSTDCPGHFNVVVVDLDAGTHAVRHYERKGAGFERSERSEDWKPLGLRTPEFVAGFRLSREQLEYLEDPELEFAHRSGKRLQLDDIFINPDFTVVAGERADNTKEDGKFLKGDAFDFFLKENKRLIITGRERSGRTSLAKKIFWTLFRDGLVPILIDGERLKGSAIQKIDSIIRTSLFSAYQNPEFPAFDQADCGTRAVILDNFERSRLGPRGRMALLKHLESKFATIVAFGDPVMFVEELTSGVILEESLPSFTRLELRELGRSARRRLIRRWHSIGIQDVEAIEERVFESEQIINTLLGRSFLPAYPIFILSFLQSIESFRPIDNIGSYGYHYEAFITNALSRHAQDISLDIKYQLLSELAYDLFSKKEEEINEVALNIFYETYCKKYGISPERKRLLSSLIESRILEQVGDAIRFKYAYAYYFFVARYFRDHLNDPEIKEHVKWLSRNFHVEQNANIWLFLAHLSKSPYLLEVIVAEAQDIFAAYPVSTLEDDAAFLRDLGELPAGLSLPPSSVDENIEKHYDRLDQLDAASTNLEQLDDPEAREVFRKMDGMVRTILVLGQVLKNFPGSLTAEEKFEVVSAGFNLGLRGLSFILEAVAKGKDELVQFFTERVAEKYGGSPTDEELKRRVRLGLFWIVRLIIFGMIKLVSHGLGAKGEESTYAKVVASIGSKSAQLIDVSISLDTLKIPRQKIFDLYRGLEDDVLNRHLLVSLVVRHLYLFPVPQNVKDELCSKLGIAVEKLARAEAALGEHTKRVGTLERPKRLPPPRSS